MYNYLSCRTHKTTTVRASSQAFKETYVKYKISGSFETKFTYEGSTHTAAHHSQWNTEEEASFTTRQNFVSGIVSGSSSYYDSHRQSHIEVVHNYDDSGNFLGLKTLTHIGTNSTSRSVFRSNSYYIKTDKNTIIHVNKNQNQPERTIRSQTYPLITVADETTTTIEWTAFTTTTTQGTGYEYYFTTDENSKFTQSIRTKTRIIEKVESVTTERAYTTTYRTNEFLTYIRNDGISVVVVADTVIYTVNNRDRDRNFIALGVLLTDREFSNTSGLTNFQYLSQNTTLSYCDPVSVTTLDYTRDVYTTFNERNPYEYTRDATSTETVQSRKITDFTTTKVTFLTFTLETQSCEDWVTFTTTRISSNSIGDSFTLSDTSYSLNTGTTGSYSDSGFNDEGNSYEYTETWKTAPVTFIYLSGTSSYEGYTTITKTEEITNTIWEDRAIIINPISLQITGPTLEVFSELNGIKIISDRIPWETKVGYDSVIARSLKLEFSSNSTQELAIRKSANFEIEHTYSVEFDGTLSRYSTTTEISKMTVWEVAGSQTGVKWPLNPELTWITADDWAVGADADLNFSTQKNLSSAPLVISLENHAHTITEPPIAFVFPNHVVPVFLPSFTTVLNRNSFGYGAHPSLWSSMTLSRAGDSLSSTWQYVKESNETNKKYSTSSGTCKFITQSAFPLNVKNVESPVGGGSFHPNTKAVCMRLPGIYHEILGNNLTTTSSFRHQENAQTENITMQSITVYSVIPVLFGYGLYTFQGVGGEL